MIHPLGNDITKLTDQELENKIQDLTKKYFQAMRFSPSVASQVVLLLDSYKLEQQDRFIAKSQKSNEGDDDIHELIKVD